MREHLLETARRLFCERGIRATTMRDIASEAPCSRATVHAQFSSKDDLVREVIRRDLQELDRVVAIPKPNSDLKEGLVRMATDYWNFWQNTGCFLILALPEIYLNKDLQTILEQEQERTVAKLTVFFGMQRDRGAWHQKISGLDLETLTDRMIPFLGGIFARVAWTMVGISREAAFDAEEYVQLFLEGYGAR